jgi:hypothetical protein
MSSFRNPVIRVWFTSETIILIQVRHLAAHGGLQRCGGGFAEVSLEFGGPVSGGVAVHHAATRRSSDRGGFGRFCAGEDVNHGLAVVSEQDLAAWLEQAVDAIPAV